MTQTDQPVPLWQRLMIGRNPKRTLVRAGVLAVTLLVTFNFLLWPVRIEGQSMEPTYHNHTVNLINRFAFRFSKPQRGDVVAIKTTGKHNMFFKRVIAMPGETVSIHQGTVIIDNEPLAEKYVVYRQAWEMPARTLNFDEYLLIGDNRGMPQEGHSWGVVKIEHIAGKAVW